MSRESERYSRQIVIRDFGNVGQQKLKSARVVVAGLGGLGSSALIYLAAAGIGHLIIIDTQRVELSNLNRQVLHWSSDVGLPKVKSASKKIKAINQETNVESVHKRITSKNVNQFIKRADVVIDGMDNYPPVIYSTRPVCETTYRLFMVRSRGW